MISAATTTPIISPYCWYFGVAPTMYPVFRSWDVAPAFAAAIATTAPTHRATGEYHSPDQPTAMKIEQVRMRVAIVIPEIGLEEEPINPTIREETVTKKNPNTTTSSEASTLPWVGIRGATARKMASSTVPPRTIDSGMSCSVRARPPASVLAEKSFTLSRNEDTMVGMVRARVIRPAAST